MKENAPKSDPAIPPPGNVDTLEAALACVRKGREWLEKCPPSHREWMLQSLRAELDAMSNPPPA